MENSQIQTINELPDEVLLKILYSLPTTKQVVSTSVLSKRWRSLWKEVNTFKYVAAEFLYRDFWSFVRFVSKRSSLESLQLKMNPRVLNRDIKPLVNIAVVRSLRELRIELFWNSFELPKSFYMFSQLHTVILERLSLADIPPDVCLVCLRSLHLLSVRFSCDESAATLLSKCPVLEDLVVRRSSYTNVRMFTIDVPTLKSLSIDYSSGKYRPKGVHGFVINTPSLRSFSIRDSFSNYLCFENMPELVKVSVNIFSHQPNSLGECLSSHLEILEWRQYNGTEQEREAAKYILANSSGLEKATFFFSESAEKHMMLKELESVARGSKTCQLVFV